MKAIAHSFLTGAIIQKLMIILTLTLVVITVTYGFYQILEVLLDSLGLIGTLLLAPITALTTVLIAITKYKEGSHVNRSR